MNLSDSNQNYSNDLIRNRSIAFYTYLVLHNEFLPRKIAQSDDHQKAIKTIERQILLIFNEHNLSK